MKNKAGPVKTRPGSVLEHAHEKNIFEQLFNRRE